MQPVKTIIKSVISNNLAYIHLNYESQAKPYNLMLKMDNIYGMARTHAGVPLYDAASANPFGTVNYAFWENLKKNAGNRSYSKLIGNLGDASSLGATLTAERRETWGMMVGILGRSISAARKIKKLNFAGAARDLGLPYHERKRTVRFQTVVRRLKSGKSIRRRIRVRRTYFDYGTGREKLKTVANGWLMYSYGMKPLMEDSYNMIDILQRPFPLKRFQGKATEKSGFTYREGSGDNLRVIVQSSVLLMKQSVSIRVKNPNLYLASQLGLVNPAQWALEAIPFSFIIDWFSNLSDVVSSFTDFVGLEVENPCVNILKKRKENQYVWSPWEAHRSGSIDFRNTSRELSLVIPKLDFRYERFQWQRGANAISLLVSLLKDK